MGNIGIIVPYACHISPPFFNQMVVGLVVGCLGVKRSAVFSGCFLVGFKQKEQHNQYAWMDSDELLNRDDVHVHTKWYVE